MEQYIVYIHAWQDMVDIQMYLCVPTVLIFQIIMNILCCCFSGPNHMPMQGPGPGPNQPPNMPSGSMNMPPSSHGSMGGYNHTVPSSQGMPAQSQMNMTQGQPMGNYGPRPNMNMQPNQGKTTVFYFYLFF